MNKLELPQPGVMPDDTAPPWPEASRAWATIALLTVANVVSLLDRQIVTLLVDPIRQDLNLSDTGIGLLHGFAFVLFYSVMALPLARWADRGPRRTIIALGVLTWSLMTTMCGLAKSFTQLFLARVGVGAGEAALAPGGNSLIADLFPPARRTLPLGIFAAGISGGLGLSLMAGGTAIAVAERIGTVELPLVGTLKPWQLVFVAVGLAGLPLAAAIMFVREPRRREAGLAPIPLREAVNLLGANRRTFFTLIAGYTLLVGAANAIAAWTAAFYMRHFGLDAAATGLWMGAAVMIGGLAGAVIGGQATDHLHRRGDRRAPTRVLAGAALLLLIPAAIGTVSPNFAFALFFLFCTFALGSATVGPTIAALQALTPGRLHAQAVALLYFFVNLVGVGTGHVAVALVTDNVFANDAAVGWSIALVATFYTLAGAMCCVAAHRSYPWHEMIPRFLFHPQPG